MKLKIHTTTIAFLACASSLFPLNAEARVIKKSSSSSSSGGSSKSVSTTTDGNKTIIKTVTIKNGVRSVSTVIKDKRGNVISESDGNRQINDRKNDRDEDRNKNKQDKDNTPQQKGAWMGVRVKEIKNTLRSQLNLARGEGVEIELIAKNSPILNSGLQVGDIILSIEDLPVSTPKELGNELGFHKPEDTVRLGYLRKGKREEVEVTLATAPQQHGEKNGHGKRHNTELTKEERHSKNNVRSSRKNRHVSQLNELLDNPELSNEFKKTLREMKRKVENSKASKYHIDMNHKNLLKSPLISRKMKRMFRKGCSKKGCSK